MSYTPCTVHVLRLQFHTNFSAPQVKYESTDPIIFYNKTLRGRKLPNIKILHRLICNFQPLNLSANRGILS